MQGISLEGATHLQSRENTAQRIIAAGCQLLGARGIGAVSVRAIAAELDLSAAAVQHHFPRKELLMRNVIAAILQRDCDHTWAWLRDLPQAPIHGDHLQRVLLGIVNRQCGTLAEHAAARNAALLSAARRHDCHDLTLRWAADKRAALAALIAPQQWGTRAAARCLLELLLGIELLSLGCRERPLLALFNEEILNFWLALLSGKRPRPAAPWVEHSVKESFAATALTPAPHDARRADILSAAARLLTESGSDQFSHRSVAAAAGVPLSAVTQHFGSKNDLLYATFTEIRSRIAEFAWQREPDRNTSMPQSILDLHIGSAPAYLGMLESVISSAHDPQFEEFAWHSRMQRGVYHLYIDRRDDRTAAPHRAMTMRPFTSQDFARHALAFWAAGATLYAEATWTPRRAPELLVARFGQINKLASAKN